MSHKALFFTPNFSPTKKKFENDKERIAIREILLSNSPGKHYHKCHDEFSPSINKPIVRRKKFQSLHIYSEPIIIKSKEKKQRQFLLVELPQVNKKNHVIKKRSLKNGDYSIINNYMNIRMKESSNAEDDKLRSIKHPQKALKLVSKEQTKKNKTEESMTMTIKDKKKKYKYRNKSKKFPPLFTQESEENQASLDQITVKKPNNIRYQISERKNMKVEKESWQEIDPFSLETYFVKLKKIDPSNSVSEIVKPKVKISSIPSKEKLSSFIRNYIPDFSQIHMEELMQSKQFVIDHDQSELYFGEVVNGNKEGKGIFLNNKTLLEGIWSKNQLQIGIQKNNQGIYKGRFQFGKRQGKGQFFWDNGEYYSGQWKNGKKHGSGYWKSKRGDIYLGQWKNGEVTGYGIHTTMTGQKYEGQFHRFLKHGRGIQTFPNGDYFEGQYVDGNPEGEGKYQWKSGIVYLGNFQKGYREGKGKLIVKNKLSFQGNFYREQIYGEGIEKMENGDVFKGTYKNGMRDGDGILTLKEEKKVFKGVWAENELQYQI